MRNPPRPPMDNPILRLSNGRFGWLGLLALLPLLALVIAGYVWFVQRVEVGPNRILVLVRKVGTELPPNVATDQVVLYPGLPGADTAKGIVYEPLAEGRHFRDPFFWQRIDVPATVIKDDEIGIQIRKFGRPLPAGKLLATEPDERGPVPGTLKPGKYNINPFAYAVVRVRPIVIPAGHVGVQTLYNGSRPKDPNRYVVEASEAGVQPTVLPPGMYYNNPYERRIDLVDVRSQTIDLHDADAIRFPSNDSFEITIDATVEYAILQERAPYVLTAVGDQDDIKEKLILPYAKSLCRIEGSKLLARDFISGEKRTEFQTRVFEGLRDQCNQQGIEIRSTLIRRIVPPMEIAGPISDRQVAAQQVRQYDNEISLAKSEAKLVEQQEMQTQAQAVGQSNREVVSVIKEAEQRKAVALTEAKKRLEVARLNLEAARQTAEALLARGRADADVRKLGYEAEARPLRDAVSAFGDGETYAQYFFYQKLAPALKSVLASTDGPFADIFGSLTRPLPAAPSRPAESPRPSAAAPAEGGVQ